jgi:hypothetical protein
MVGHLYSKKKKMLNFSVAAREGYKEAVEFLIEHDIDTKIKENKGRTAKDVAIIYKKQNLVEFMDKVVEERKLTKLMEKPIQKMFKKMNNEKNELLNSLKEQQDVIIEQQKYIIEQHEFIHQQLLQQQDLIEKHSELLKKLNK